MTDRGRHAERTRSPWRYAVVGGLASVPLVVASNWQTVATTEFSLGFVLVGGVLAGVLAGRAGVDSVRAGFGAGVIGSLVGYGWLLDALIESAASFGAAWSFPPVTVVLAVVFSAIVLGVGGVRPGGRVARPCFHRAGIDRRRSVGPSSPLSGSIVRTPDPIRRCRPARRARHSHTARR